MHQDGLWATHVVRTSSGQICETISTLWALAVFKFWHSAFFDLTAAGVVVMSATQDPVKEQCEATD
jgi:hypothetical protein